ncbi:hypothetical protein [Bordetella pertussis]|uniref:hypothetical protein n=1 Tax=Bordetella pertussis TaxID=520 RepID=UPI001E31CB9F|nr:hypothetical protein [Bordetella pertussis]
MMRGSSLTWRSLLSCAARSSVSRRESRLLTVSTSVSIAGSSPRSRSVQDVSRLNLDEYNLLTVHS